jgi:hypothetical protein
VLPDVGLAVASVSVVHPATTKNVRPASQIREHIAAAKDTEKQAKYGVGGAEGGCRIYSAHDRVV